MGNLTFKIVTLSFKHYRKIFARNPLFRTFHLMPVLCLTTFFLMSVSEPSAQDSQSWLNSAMGRVGKPDSYSLPIPDLCLQCCLALLCSSGGLTGSPPPEQA